jgi:hypothetical protein
MRVEVCMHESPKIWWLVRVRRGLALVRARSHSTRTTLHAQRQYMQAHLYEQHATQTCIAFSCVHISVETAGHVHANTCRQEDEYCVRAEYTRADFTDIHNVHEQARACL